MTLRRASARVAPTTGVVRPDKKQLSTSEELRSRAQRILSWSDAILVETQNVSWITRRFGIAEQFRSLTHSAMNEVQPLPQPDTYLMHLPRWRRRMTTLWRTFAKQDAEARWRFRTWIAMRLPRDQFS